MSKKRYLKKEAIRAVLEEDLEEFLSSLNILESINSGQINCDNCNKIITLDNLGSIFPKNNRINLFCNSVLCLSNADFEDIETNG